MVPCSMRLILLLAAAALASCSVAPTYQSPAIDTAKRWYAPRPHDGDSAKLRDWWSRFDDALLVRLIDVAQRDNPSVLAAVARIDNARANARVAGAALWPSVALNASGQRTASGVPPFAQPRTFGGVTADATWEFDLFGGIESSRVAARARVEAREADWHDVFEKYKQTPEYRIVNQGMSLADFKSIFNHVDNVEDFFRYNQDKVTAQLINNTALPTAIDLDHQSAPGLSLKAGLNAKVGAGASLDLQYGVALQNGDGTTHTGMARVKIPF